MPLPFIIAGAAIALGAKGLSKGIQTKGMLEEAKEIGERAENRLRNQQERLDTSRQMTNEALETLGKQKVEVFSNQIQHLVEVIKKGKSKLSNFDVSIDLEQLKSSERYISAEGINFAKGAFFIGSNINLSFLGSIGGFMLASKAEEAMTVARGYEARSDEAIEKIKIALTGLKAIRTNAAELSNVITQLAKRFDEVKVSSVDDRKKFKLMLDVGKALKSTLEIPILDESGAASIGLSAKLSGYKEIIGSEAS